MPSGRRSPTSELLLARAGVEHEDSKFNPIVICVFRSPASIPHQIATGSSRNERSTPCQAETRPLRANLGASLQHGWGTQAGRVRSDGNERRSPCPAGNTMRNSISTMSKSNRRGLSPAPGPGREWQVPSPNNIGTPRSDFKRPTASSLRGSAKRPQSGRKVKMRKATRAVQTLMHTPCRRHSSAPLRAQMPPRPQSNTA
jgi:hypothetical protein